MSEDVGVKVECLILCPSSFNLSIVFSMGPVNTVHVYYTGCHGGKHGPSCTVFGVFCTPCIVYMGIPCCIWCTVRHNATKYLP